MSDFVDNFFIMGTKTNKKQCKPILKLSMIKMWQQVVETLADPAALTTNLFLESFWGRPSDGQLGIIWHLWVRLSQAKIADLCHNVVRDQHVTSGQISVNQLLGLQVLHPFTHVAKKTHPSRCQTVWWVVTVNLGVKFINEPTGQSAAAEVLGRGNVPWSWES